MVKRFHCQNLSFDVSSFHCEHERVSHLKQRLIVQCNTYIGDSMELLVICKYLYYWQSHTIFCFHKRKQLNFYFKIPQLSLLNVLSSISKLTIWVGLKQNVTTKKELRFPIMKFLFISSNLNLYVDTKLQL